MGPEPGRPGLLARLRGLEEQASLRARLVAVLLVVLVLALGVTAVASQALLRRFLISRVDVQLVSAAVPVARQAAMDLARPGDPRSPLPSAYVVQFFYPDGRTAATVRSPLDASAAAPALPSLPTAAVRRHADRPFTVPATSGPGSWRVLARTLPGGQGSVAVALPLTEVDATVARLQLLGLAVGAVALLASGALGAFAVRRAFRPLADIEHVAAAIAAGDLGRRVPARSTRTEMGRLAAALNGMLAQIERAFRARAESEARMRRFVADASHELRTPLAAVRGFAELYRQGAVRGDAEVTRTMRRIEDESIRMGGLVEDLLLLARLDEQRPPRRDPVDLLVLAADAVHDARALDPGRVVTLDSPGTGSGAGCVVAGDEARLRQVVGNLVANALQHTPAGTPVEVAVVPDGSWVAWHVVDHGPGLAPDQAARVFERFYRADPSRSRGQGGGAGLGLAIVAAIVGAHAGSVDVVPTPGGGATFRVRLPRG